MTSLPNDPNSNAKEPIGSSLPSVRQSLIIPEEVATQAELTRAATDRPFAAELIMGRMIPFNNFVGIEILEVSTTAARLRLVHRPEHTGDPTRPALHGGALAVLADTAGGTLVLAAVDHGDKVSTLDMRIDYLRPADLKDTYADASIVRIGSRAAVVRMHLWQYADDDQQERRQIADSTAVFSVYRN